MAQTPADGRGAALGAFPLPVPAEAAEVEEPAAREMLRAMRVCPIDVPAMGAHVQTAYVTNAEDGSARGAPAALHFCSMYALIDLAVLQELGKARLVGFACVAAQTTCRLSLSPGKRACQTRPHHAREHSPINEGAPRRRGRAAAAPAWLRLVAAGVPAAVPAAGGRRRGDVGGGPGGCDVNSNPPCPGSRSAGATCSTLGSKHACAQHTAPCCHSCWACSWSPCTRTEERRIRAWSCGVEQAVAMVRLVNIPGRITCQSASSSGLRCILRSRHEL
jgi:hypothetical protein